MAEKKETKPVEKKTQEAMIQKSPNPVVKKRKPRQPQRSIEEIANLPEHKLTEAEKIKLIKKLKEEYTLAKNKFEECKHTCESAFEQNRQLEEQYKAMETFYTDQFKYINGQLNSFHAAINKVTKGA